MRTSVLSALALAAQTLAGVVPVKFDILRGTSINNAVKDVSRTEKLFKRELHKREDGSVSLSLKDESYYYAVSISISDSSFTVMVDTGSSDLWIYGSDNPYCETTGSSSGRKEIIRGASPNAIKVGEVKHDADPKFLLENQKRDVKYGAAPEDIKADLKKNVIHNPDPSVILAGSATEQHPLEKRATSSSNSLATIDCAAYGTYDITSEGFNNNDTLFFIQYGDLTYALGTWGYADLTFDNTTVNDFSFAVANQSNSTTPVFGIGLVGLEATASSFMDNYGGSHLYENLPAALKTQGLIEKTMYSLYMDSDSGEGVVLFGGIDHGKYTGDLATLPLLNYYEDDGATSPITFDVSLDGIVISDDDESVNVWTSSVSALLDSGTSLVYLPESAVSNIMSSIGAEYSYSAGEYVVSCPSKSTGIILTYLFNGANISVPIEDSLLPIDSSAENCAVMIKASDRVILGDTFLRHAYVAFDLEELQVQIAPYENGDSDIEVVSAGSSGSSGSSKDKDPSSSSSSSSRSHAASGSGSATKASASTRASSTTATASSSSSSSSSLSTEQPHTSSVGEGSSSAPASASSNTASTSASSAASAANGGSVNSLDNLAALALSLFCLVF